MLEMSSLAGQQPGASSKSTEARRAKCDDCCRRSVIATDIFTRFSKFWEVWGGRFWSVTMKLELNTEKWLTSGKKRSEIRMETTKREKTAARTVRLMNKVWSVWSVRKGKVQNIFICVQITLDLPSVSKRLYLHGFWVGAQESEYFLIPLSILTEKNQKTSGFFCSNSEHIVIERKRFIHTEKVFEGRDPETSIMFLVLFKNNNGSLDLEPKVCAREREREGICSSLSKLSTATKHFTNYDLVLLGHKIFWLQIFFWELKVSSFALKKADRLSKTVVLMTIFLEHIFLLFSTRNIWCTTSR